MSTPKVGADIESICGRCGDVWHVVVAMVGSEGAKVVCKQCGRQHRYRPPGGAARSPRRKRSGHSRAKSQPASAEPLVPVDSSRPLRRYQIAESYAVGDRITHRTFGDGVVELEVGPQKIQVFFPGGRRVLAHERSDLADS